MSSRKPTPTSSSSIPGYLSPSCDYNITENLPSYGPVVWTNCCAQSNATENCPPQETFATCPEGYFNCGDPSKHPDMCSRNISLSGYTDLNSLNRKCCPENYFCGSSFSSPCEWAPTAALPSTTPTPPIAVLSPTVILTNPQILTSAGVFAGCNDSKLLSPTVVGVIVALGILTFIGICSLLLWSIRRILYRIPGQRDFKNYRDSGVGGVLESRGDREEVEGGKIRVTTEVSCKVEDKPVLVVPDGRRLGDAGEGGSGDSRASSRSGNGGRATPGWVDLGEAAERSRAMEIREI
ncbi:hypothetical protein RUND412_000628 [Rhizina undulata]